MANHPSAEKRNRQRVKRTDRNRAVTSTVRTLVKRVRTAIHAKDAKAAETALNAAAVALDKAASKGVIHANQAANRKSGVARRVNAMA